jgi:hypothetical protein
LNIEVQYKTAWFLAHCIREAMRTGGFAPLGGVGGIVEADDIIVTDLRFNLKTSECAASTPVGQLDDGVGRR